MPGVFMCGLLHQRDITKKIPNLEIKPANILQTTTCYKGNSEPILRYGAALLGQDDLLKSKSFPIRASLTFSLYQLCTGFARQRGEGSIYALLDTDAG